MANLIATLKEPSKALQILPCCASVAQVLLCTFRYGSRKRSIFAAFQCPFRATIESLFERFSVRPRFVLSSVLALVAMDASAASQGSLEPVSYGQMTVQVEIPAKVRISGLSNMDFGIFPGVGTGDMNMDQDVCVYSNTPSGKYRVTATGSGAGGAFTMLNAGATIPYQAYWNDVTGTTSREILTPSAALINQTGANQASENCSVGGESANVSIYLYEPDLLYKPNGRYVGTLTLLIEPE